MIHEELPICCPGCTCPTGECYAKNEGGSGHFVVMVCGNNEGLKEKQLTIVLKENYKRRKKHKDGFFYRKRHPKLYKNKEKIFTTNTIQRSRSPP